MKKADAIKIQKEKKKLQDSQIEARIKLDSALEILQAAAESCGLNCAKNGREREIDFLLNYGKLNQMLYIAIKYIINAKDSLEVYF